MSVFHCLLAPSLFPCFYAPLSLSFLLLPVSVFHSRLFPCFCTPLSLSSFSYHPLCFCISLTPFLYFADILLAPSLFPCFYTPLSLSSFSLCLYFTDSLLALSLFSYFFTTLSQTLISCSYPPPCFCISLTLSLSSFPVSIHPCHLALSANPPCFCISRILSLSSFPVPLFLYNPVTASHLFLLHFSRFCISLTFS